MAWRQGDPLLHGSLVAGPRHIFSIDGADLDTFGRREGSPAWQAGNDFFVPPAGADDMIFVSDTSDDGGIVVYDTKGSADPDDTRTGTKRQRYDLTERALTGPTPAGDTLFIVESGGDDESRRLVVLRAG